MNFVKSFLFLLILLFIVAYICFTQNNNTLLNEESSQKFKNFVNNNKYTTVEDDEIVKVHKQFKNSKDKIEFFKAALLQEDEILLHRILTEGNEKVSKTEAKAFVKLVEDGNTTKSFVKDFEETLQSFENQHVTKGQKAIRYGNGQAFLLIIRNNEDESDPNQYSFKLPINTCAIKSETSGRVEYLLKDKIESFTIKEAIHTATRQFKVGIVEVPLQMKHDNYYIDGKLKIHSAQECDVSIRLNYEYIRINVKNYEELEDVSISINGYTHPIDLNYNTYTPVPSKGKYDVYLTGKLHNKKIETNHIVVDFSKIKHNHQTEDSDAEDLPVDAKFIFNKSHK